MERKLTRRGFIGDVGKAISVAVVGTNIGCPFPTIERRFYDTEYFDGEVSRDLQVGVWSPRAEQGEVFPVVGFSHGYFTSPKMYGGYLEGIAKKGRIIVAPFHNDSFNIQGDRNLREVMRNLFENVIDIEEMVFEMQQIPGYENIDSSELEEIIIDQGFLGEIDNPDVLGIIHDNFDSRVRELERGIDFVEELGDSKLKDMVDVNNVALVSHSFGSYSCIESILDNPLRYQGGLMLSGVSGLSDTSQLKVPTCWVTGTKDEIKIRQSSRDSFESVSGLSSYVDIQGAGHISFCEGAMDIYSRIMRNKSDRKLTLDIPDLEVFENHDEKSRVICDLTDSFLDNCLGCWGNVDDFLSIEENNYWVAEYASR